jgi:hypothetical protein
MRKKIRQQNNTPAPAKPTTEPKQPDQPKPSPENHSIEANDTKVEYQKSVSGKEPVSKPEHSKPTATKTDKPAQPIQPNKKTTTDAGISIKAELNKKESTVSTKQAGEMQDNTKPVENNDFDQDKLIEAWLSFAEKHKQQPRLYQNLKKYQPVLKDNYNIEVGMPSESMKNVLISIKSEILNDLQQQLNNTGIDLKVKTTKIKSSDSFIPYTAEEKYKAMVKKNPAIEKLRNDLDMSVR